ncbi:MAG: hypothetical protein PVI75_00370 [Gammaproteobacteria bacterium]|jgi:hypothetical protein
MFNKNKIFNGYFSVSLEEKKSIQLVKFVLKNNQIYQNKKCIITNEPEIRQYIMQYLGKVHESIIIECLRKSITQCSVVYGKNGSHVYVLMMKHDVFENEISKQCLQNGLKYQQLILQNFNKIFGMY